MCQNEFRTCTQLHIFFLKHILYLEKYIQYEEFLLFSHLFLLSVTLWRDLAMLFEHRWEKEYFFSLLSVIISWYKRLNLYSFTFLFFLLILGVNDYTINNSNFLKITVINAKNMR